MARKDRKTASAGRGARPGKVLVAATGKGGAGKSTAIACLATYWASEGHKVALVDADPNQTLTRWHKKGRELSGLTLCTETDEHAIIPAIVDLAAEHDLVLVDCAGFKNQAMIFAIGAADLVLIPAMTDEANVFEAMRTRKLVESASQLSRRAIDSRAVLCRVKRSQVAVHARKQLESLKVAPLTAQFNDRVIFQEATFYGTSPTVLAPKGAAAVDVAQVAHEIEAIFWPK
ncbi:MAG: ParA family protein [Magnetospirillum sp. WYHS-4]